MPTKKVSVERYRTDDLIIPMLLQQASHCEIGITITRKEIYLQVDRRDITWDRKSKKVIATGTLLTMRK